MILDTCNNHELLFHHLIENEICFIAALASLEGMKSKEAKKILGPLFSNCDEFRSLLNEKGIGIKVM